MKSRYLLGGDLLLHLTMLTHKNRDNVTYKSSLIIDGISQF